MNRLQRMATRILVTTGMLTTASTLHADVWDSATHGYADNDGVRIHYATVGEGPQMVMIHGFPDFWYSWRHQMEGLQDEYQVVAVDQRGYNLSDQPAGDENYDMRLLTADAAERVTETLRWWLGAHR